MKKQILNHTVLLIFILIGFSALQAYSQDVGLLEYEKNTIEVFENTAASVVYITNKVIRRDIFSRDATEVPRGSGSGFVWDKKGHIVTNYHVIQDANILTVTFSDSTTYTAKLVGAEPSKDIAVIRVDAPARKLKPIPVGYSNALQVGQKVMAIGNPFGLDHSLTVGTVSALGREMTTDYDRKIRDVIQTDAAINPGNSGGPLIDSRGLLIGMNTAIITPTGANAGIGFAVPVDTVKWIVPELIKHGKIIRPGLGIFPLRDSIARRNDIEGVIIGEVQKGSAAEKAGLKGLSQNRRGDILLGDVIIGIKGMKVTDNDTYALAMEKCKIGETVIVEYLRDGKKRTTRVKLQRID